LAHFIRISQTEKQLYYEKNMNIQKNNENNIKIEKNILLIKSKNSKIGLTLKVSSFMRFLYIYLYEYGYKYIYRYVCINTYRSIHIYLNISI
jgi:galactose mutarotase-like enzyme